MRVDIVPVGDVAAAVKRSAASALRSVYDAEVTIRPASELPAAAYDEGRGQYGAEAMIDLASRDGQGDKNIALTDVDLFYRRRNFVFGLAYLDGDGSVVSTHRLRTSPDGGVAGRSAQDVFADRVRKEVIHEVGHSLGLDHCDNSRCVMSFSPTVREVDVKEEHFCGSCSQELD